MKRNLIFAVAFMAILAALTSGCSDRQMMTPQEVIAPTASDDEIVEVREPDTITVTKVYKGSRTALVYAEYEGEEVLIGSPDDKSHPNYDANGEDNFLIGDVIQIKITDDYIYDNRWRVLLTILVKNITRPEVVYDAWVETDG